MNHQRLHSSLNLARAIAPGPKPRAPQEFAVRRRGGSNSRPMELTAYRDRFPILGRTTYLINHSLGAMPAAAEERMLEYARTWKERGIRAWGEGWWEMPLTVGDQIARIIGAP